MSFYSYSACKSSTHTKPATVKIFARLHNMSCSAVARELFLDDWIYTKREERNKDWKKNRRRFFLLEKLSSNNSVVETGSSGCLLFFGSLKTSLTHSPSYFRLFPQTTYFFIDYTDGKRESFGDWKGTWQCSWIVEWIAKNNWTANNVEREFNSDGIQVHGIFYLQLQR